jgi:hypothetical protein
MIKNGFAALLFRRLVLVCLIGMAPRVAAAEPPVILFWTAYPYQLPHITHFTPNVGLGADTETAFSQPRLVQAGIVPLKSVPGKVLAKDLSALQLAQRWISAGEQGYAGIAIDEFGSGDRLIDDRMIEALDMTRKGADGLFIAVWHAGLLTRDVARAYARSADLVLLETYVAGDSGLAWHFGPKLLAARMYGLLRKTVFALGINDVDRRLGATMKPWANSPDELQAQMRWIRARAPEMPGVAFFASHASFEIQREASEIAWSVFTSR